jgi:hypothetical protein
MESPLQSGRGLALAILIGSCVAAAPAAGLILDWDVVGWPGGTGTLSNTFLNVDGSTMDITVTITDSNPSSLTAANSPEVNNDFTPPSSSGDDLFIQATGNNDGSGGNTGIEIRFDFSGLGVTSLNFDIYDVDLGGNPWTDVLILRATPAGGGASILPTSVIAPTATPSWSYDPVAGQVTGTGGAASNSDDGTVVIDFATPVTSVTVQYLNGDDFGGNQWIAFSDLIFAPEPDPTLLVLSALAAWACIRRRR